VYVPEGSIQIPIQPITKPVWKPAFRGRGGSWGSKTYDKFRKEVVGPLEDACEDIDILWEPLEVTVVVRTRRPGTTKFPFPQGDVDNFSKAILDACTDILWVDDWQIRKLTIDKEWTNDPYFEVHWRVLDDYSEWPIFDERLESWRLANES
jgi:Holliday junction resolvase RusA-like endonuclease